MKLAKDDLIAALRLRYDYYSAQTVFDVARERAGLVDQPAYEVPHVAAFRSALEAVGDRVEKVQARLDALLEGSGGVPVAAPAAPPASAAPAAEASAKDSDKHVGKDKDAAKDKDVAKDKDGGKDVAKDVAKDKDGGKDKPKRAADAKSGKSDD